MDDKPVSRHSRWIRIALAVSVGLNLLVVGVIAGAAFDGRGPGMHGGRPGPEGALGPVGLRLYSAALPADGRRAMLAALRADDQVLRDGRSRLRVHIQTMTRLLQAEPFSIDAVRAELETQADSVGGMMRHGADILVDQIATMTPGERADFAAALGTRLKRDDRRKRP